MSFSAPSPSPSPRLPARTAGLPPHPSVWGDTDGAMSEQTRSYSTAAPDEYSSRVSSTGAAKQRPTSGASPCPLGSIISHKHRVTGAVLSRYQSQLLLTGASLHPPYKKRPDSFWSWAVCMLRWGWGLLLQTVRATSVSGAFTAQAKCQIIWVRSFISLICLADTDAEAPSMLKRE